MKLLNLLKTKTVSQSILTSVATGISGILGILFYSLLARQLTQSEFGIFSVSIVTLTLLADIANVGTDTGIIRFVGKYINSDYKKSLRFLKLGFKLKLIVGIAIAMLGWVASPWIAKIILQKPGLALPLQIVSIGCPGVMLFSFATSGIQSIQKFLSWAIITVTANAARLLIILVLGGFAILTLPNSLIVYIVLPFLCFFIALFILPRFISVRNENQVAKEFFHYNKWVALFILIAAISSRLDVYISTRLLSLSEVGIYAVATGLSSIVIQVVAAIATVVAPKLASLKNNNEAKKYLIKLQIFVSVLALAGFVVGSVLSFFAIPLLYGQQYSASIPIFIILLFAQAIFLISVPAHTSVFYYFGYPKLFVYISVLHILIISLLGWIIIQNFGIIGAAVTYLIGNISNFVFPLLWILWRFRK